LNRDNEADSFDALCEDIAAGTLDTMRTVRSFLGAKAARIVGALVASAVVLTTLSAPPASAATALKCSAVVLRPPHQYGVVTISVSTRPLADVSATETAGAHSWSMSPNAAANGGGKARLSQKISTVRKYELVRVTVHVTLGGSTGSCSTRYTPPSLAAQN
jgi:hypothetical protein